ncbi:hypothetical protein AX279_19775 [Pseudomonas sp. J237]|nr:MULTISPECIES: hypothetical protein [Pseudomonas]OEO24072.1 hypothetical protein AX279_19775 [Pseudomonas sp. J237]
MTDYVNNYLEETSLAAGATSLALALPDGEFLLTLADSKTDATRWEIVKAVVASGVATLTRAQEGTTDQTWPIGSVIYCSLTAGAIAGFGGGGGGSDTGWLPAPLEAGVDYGPEYRNLNGVVYLRGYVYAYQSGFGSPIATLPEGSRPSNTMWLDITINGNRRYRIYVGDDGGIFISAQLNGQDDYFGFDFISFPAG